MNVYVRQAVLDYISNQNVEAFSRVLRTGESYNDERAWTIRYGGWDPIIRRYNPPKTFTDMSDHPRVDEPRPDGRTSSAAGAFQFTRTTWDEIVADVGKDILYDFSAGNQYKAYIALLAKRGILDLVVRGYIREAIAKARPTWTSLPGASEDHGRRSMDKAVSEFIDWGGVVNDGVTQPAAPIIDKSIPHVPRPEEKQAMPFPAILTALATAFGPALVQMIPQLAKLFTKADDPKQVRNMEAIQIVFDTIMKATGTTTVEGAVTAMQKDPVVAKQTQIAVLTEPAIMSILEIGEGGIKAAREANVRMAESKIKLRQNPAFLVTLMVVPMVFFVVALVLAGSGLAVTAGVLAGVPPESLAILASAFGFSPDMKNVVIGAVMSGMAAGVMAFWYGTTYSASRTAAANLPPEPPTK